MKNIFYNKENGVFVQVIFTVSFFWLLPVGHCKIYGRGWMKIDSKVCDVVTCVNRNLKAQIF